MSTSILCDSESLAARCFPNIPLTNGIILLLIFISSVTSTNKFIRNVTSSLDTSDSSHSIHFSSHNVTIDSETLSCKKIDVNRKLDMRLIAVTLKYIDNDGKEIEICLLDQLASNWRDIGLAIGLSDRKLDSIRQSNPVSGT